MDSSPRRHPMKHQDRIPYMSGQDHPTIIVPSRLAHSGHPLGHGRMAIYPIASAMVIARQDYPYDLKP